MNITRIAKTSDNRGTTTNKDIQDFFQAPLSISTETSSNNLGTRDRYLSDKRDEVRSCNTSAVKMSDRILIKTHTKLLSRNFFNEVVANQMLSDDDRDKRVIGDHRSRVY